MNMQGCKDLIVDDFYSSIEMKNRMSFLPGQLYWGHAIYPTEYPHILKLSHHDPIDARNHIFVMKPYSDGDENHYPVKELGLREGELFYIYKGKKRLVIIVGYVESGWLTDQTKQKILLCAPVFSFKSQHPQEMVIEVQAFEHPSMFYLPPNLQGCLEESAIRFEFIQPIMKGHLQPFKSESTSKPVILSNDAYALLMCHLVSFMCGKTLDKDYCEYIEEYKKTLLKTIRQA